MTDRNLLDPTRTSSGSTTTRSSCTTRTSGTRSRTRWHLGALDRPAAPARARHRPRAEPRLRGRTFFRMGILLPQVTSLVAVALIFTQLFSRYGLFNYLLGQFGIGNVELGGGSLLLVVRPLDDGHLALDGYNALLYLAAMQAIPDELYEAAAVDGARRWQQFVHVTVPMIRPTIIFTVIISTIGGLQLFTEPFLFQPIKSGAPAAPAASTRRSRCTCTRRRSAAAVRVRLRLRDRVVPLPADRGDLARQLPDHPQDPVGGLMTAVTGQARARPAAGGRSRRFDRARPADVRLAARCSSAIVDLPALLVVRRRLARQLRLGATRPC